MCDNKTMTKIRPTAQRGAVSLFIVIFATLLLTVLTVGFIQLMIREQESALNSDLSQSAYDSAMAGVEDGKRAIRKCLDGDATACGAISAGECDTVHRAGVLASASATGTEVRIVGDAAPDASLNQAYTCVKIAMDTDNVRVNLRKNQSMLVPLNASDSFDSIRVRWMHKNTGGSDTYYGGDVENLAAPTGGGNIFSLPPEAGWNENAPSMLRAQAILPDRPAATDPVMQGDLDGRMSSTVFLRPSTVTAAPSSPNDVTIGGDRAANNDANISSRPFAVACSRAEYDAGGYACLATLNSPYQVPQRSAVAYLRLTSLYRDTSVQIELLRGGTPVKFFGVQPEIDSTGRANNVFRRVISRVSPTMSQVAYPEYAVDITGSLCKDFYITSDPAQAGTSGSPVCNTRP